MATNLRMMLPNVIVPNRWIQVIETSGYRYDPPWYFFWEPSKPCNMCDSGALYKLSNNVEMTPNIYIEWEYIELLADAERLKKPHGLAFTKGKLAYMPDYIRRALFHFLTKENKYTILNEFQYHKWLKNKWIKYYPKTIDGLERKERGDIKDKRKRRPYKDKENKIWCKKIKQGLLKRKIKEKQRRIYGTED